MVNALKIQHFTPYIFGQICAFMKILSGMVNSIDPDQTAPGSSLFPYAISQTCLKDHLY